MTAYRTIKILNSNVTIQFTVIYDLLKPSVNVDTQ